MSHTRKSRRFATATILIALLTAGTATAAGAFTGGTASTQSTQHLSGSTHHTTSRQHHTIPCDYGGVSGRTNDRLIRCFANRFGVSVRMALCIADHESSDYAYARSGSNLGILQLDRGHFAQYWHAVRRWAKPKGRVGPMNARAAVIAGLWHMRRSTGYWTTAAGCGG